MKGKETVSNIQSFRDLEIWQLGMDIAQATYRLTADLLADERYGLSSQMRRAAVSVPSNIAEGWGRGTQPHLANFIKISRGSAAELETLIEICISIGLGTNSFGDIPEDLATFGRKSYAFLTKIEKANVREEGSLYGVGN